MEILALILYSQSIWKVLGVQWVSMEETSSQLGLWDVSYGDIVTYDLICCMGSMERQSRSTWYVACMVW